MSASPRIVIVGAGIVGAALAHRLGRRGADVTVIDRAARAGDGVSGASFGWVNTLTCDPREAPEAFRLRRAAIGHWRALDRELGGRIVGHAAGAVMWCESAEATREWGEAQSTRGALVRPLAPPEMRVLLPAVAQPPDLAIHAPEELAFAPGPAARRLLQASGATFLGGTEVRHVIDRRGRVAGVALASGEEIAADVVIVAAGLATRALLGIFVADLVIGASPSALVPITADASGLGCILNVPGLQIRPAGANRLLAAASPIDGETDEAIARRVLDRCTQVLNLPETPRLHSAGVRRADRPVPRGATLVHGPVAALPGLWAALGHPGVILAPTLADTLGAAILDERMPHGPEPAPIH